MADGEASEHMVAAIDVLPDLGDKPNQPKLFPFPKCKIGDQKPTFRSFQSLWFEKWPRISYDKTHDKAFCFICVKAVQQERVRECTLTSKTQDAFLSHGFTIGKMPLVKSMEDFLFTNAPR